MAKKKGSIRSMGDVSINEMFKKGQGYQNAPKKTKGDWAGPDLDPKEMFKTGKGYTRG